MGWILPNAANVLASGIGSQSNSFVDLPSGIKDGDEVWVCLFTDSWDSATTGSAPAGQGWSTVGTQFTSANWTGLAMIVFRKTWHTGDPKTGLAFLNPSGNGLACSYISWIVRSDSASPPISVVSDNRSAFAAGGAHNLPAAGAVSNGDMRMIFMMANSVGNSVNALPAPASSSDNPTQVKPKLVLDAGFNGVANWDFALFIGIWRDDALDAGTESATFGVVAPAQCACRIITLSDGSTYNGGTPADVEEVFLIDPNVQAVAIEEEGSASGLSSAAGIFGGGAHIV